MFFFTELQCALGVAASCSLTDVLRRAFCGASASTQIQEEFITTFQPSSRDVDIFFPFKFRRFAAIRHPVQHTERCRTLYGDAGHEVYRCGDIGGCFSPPSGGGNGAN